jgi:3-deoxy-D-manno-octulosonic-acid transferase
VRRVREAGIPLRLVVAPRHPGRADAVEADVKGEGLAVVRRTRLPASGPPPATDAVVLLDTVGELEAVYSLADVAFVGGSLVEHGGHNMMEPASLGKPVIVGPHTFNFRGEVDLLVAADGLAQVADAEALHATLLRWLREPAVAAQVGARGRDAILASKGATARTLEVLRPLLGRLQS